MANWLLIPGRGGRATTPAASSAAVMTDADATTYYLDCSRCTGISIQQVLVGAASLAGTFQIKETVDGTNFAALGGPISIATAQIDKLEAATRPLGRIEFDLTNVTGIDSTHTVQLVIQGAVIYSV